MRATLLAVGKIYHTVSQMYALWCAEHAIHTEIHIEISCSFINFCSFVHLVCRGVACAPCFLVPKWCPRSKVLCTVYGDFNKLKL